MPSLDKMSDDDIKSLAISTFNEIWNYLDNFKELKPWEKELMVGVAHASRFFWGKVGKPINYQRGEWMLSHVYTLVDRGEPALHHALQCWELTEKENIKDFDLAFAYEALARAYALNGKNNKAEEAYKKAENAAESIEKQDDKDYFLDELKKGPWFDIKFN